MIDLGALYTFFSRHFWRKVDNIYLQGNQSITTPNLQMAGILNFSISYSTIASGVATAASNIVRVDAESGTSDDLVTLNPSDGASLLVCVISATGETITVKDGTGNINLPSGDVVLNSINDNLWLYKRAATSDWVLFNSQGY